MTITAARPVRATRCLPLGAGSEDSELLGRVVDFYHRKLYDNQAALDYLAGRGIGSQEGIDTFRIGWADRDLGRALPSKEVKAGREIRSRLTQLGVYRVLSRAVPGRHGRERVRIAPEAGRAQPGRSATKCLVDGKWQAHAARSSRRR